MMCTYLNGIMKPTAMAQRVQDGTLPQVSPVAMSPNLYEVEECVQLTLLDQQAST